MKSEKDLTAQNSENLLTAMANSSIQNLSSEEILEALTKEGIVTLEGLVTKYSETRRHFATANKKTESGINMEHLSKPTTK